MQIRTLQDLELLRAKISESRAAERGKIRIIVYGSTCGLASGANKVLDAVREAVGACNRDDVLVLEHGCMGCCFIEPYISITQEGLDFTVYGYLDGEKAGEVVRSHLQTGEILEKYRVDLGMPFFSSRSEG
jgi:(2Fe-2S) ferredoxin